MVKIITKKLMLSIVLIIMIGLPVIFAHQMGYRYGYEYNQIETETYPEYMYQDEYYEEAPHYMMMYKNNGFSGFGIQDRDRDRMCWID